MNLPNEMICHILNYCDNYEDNYNWSLVCKTWSNLMKDPTKQVLMKQLRNDIINMAPESNINSYKFIYIKSKIQMIVIRSETNFNSLFFICAGDKIHIQDKIELYDDKVCVGVTVKQTVNYYPYYYASIIPTHKNVGYICVPVVGDINKIVIKFGEMFSPILILTN